MPGWRSSFLGGTKEGAEDGPRRGRSLQSEQLAVLAKVLAHPAWVKVVKTLLRRQTCIGCDLVEEIGLAASTTSEYLRSLKQAGGMVGASARPRV